MSNKLHLKDKIETNRSIKAAEFNSIEDFYLYY